MSKRVAEEQHDVVAKPYPGLRPTARLFVNGYGIATWSGLQANDSTALQYAREVARVLRIALRKGGLGSRSHDETRRLLEKNGYVPVVQWRRPCCDEIVTTEQALREVRQSRRRGA